MSGGTLTKQVPSNSTLPSHVPALPGQFGIPQSPRAPSAARTGLVVVPSGAVGTLRKNLQAAIVIHTHVGRGRDAPAKGTPPRPLRICPVGNGLPVVIHTISFAEGKDLQPAI
jgi:hypothetical protein